MEFSFIYLIPIWFIGLFFLIVLLSSLELGYRIGLGKGGPGKEDSESAGGKAIVGSMLALMGLIVAFTYAAAVQRFELRKVSAIEEANALSTAYLRADLMADPGSTELKEAILNYARTRLTDKTDIVSKEDIRLFMQNTLSAKDKLWPITEKIIKETNPGHKGSTLIASINNVLDMHTKRLAAGIDKLPLAVTLLMLFIAAACLSVAGYNSGVYGTMSRWRVTVFALVLTLVFFVIQDFDRPREGLIYVPLDSLADTIAEMEADLKK